MLHRWALAGRAAPTRLRGTLGKSQTTSAICLDVASPVARLNLHMPCAHAS